MLVEVFHGSSHLGAPWVREGGWTARGHSPFAFLRLVSDQNHTSLTSENRTANQRWSVSGFSGILKSMLSVVICTKNEEKNIKRCLDSIQGVADEIIVVDSMSTDKTPHICRQTPKVKFFPMPWEGFAKTKNKANQLAQNPYILSLDADEELTLDLQTEIQSLKANGLKGVYRLNRLTNYAGFWVRHSGWFPDRKIRIFPKKGSQWVGDHVHEILEYPPDLPLTDCKGLLNHYSVSSVADHVKKVRSYSSLGAEKVAKKRPLLVIAISMVFNPPLRFIRHFVFKLGFLDGIPGILIAALSSYSVFLKYKRAFEIKRSSQP